MDRTSWTPLCAALLAILLLPTLAQEKKKEDKEKAAQKPLSKEEIERYGVEPFIHKCLESVFRYTREWERLTDRLGFWINLDEAYVTYHQSYIESVWWSLADLYRRGLLYQGHKIVWWWAQGGTALSSGEVGQGYREVADPSVYVRFPLLDAGA